MLAHSIVAPSAIAPVCELTNDTFRDFVEKNDMVLVAFVLPFLLVFHRFMEVYQEVTTTLNLSAT